METEVLRNHTIFRLRKFTCFNLPRPGNEFFYDSDNNPTSFPVRKQIRRFLIIFCPRTLKSNWTVDIFMHKSDFEKAGLSKVVQLRFIGQVLS